MLDHFVGLALKGLTFVYLFPPIGCISQKKLKIKEKFHVNSNLCSVGLFSNIPVVRFDNRDFPKLTFYYRLMTKYKALPATQICLKDFPYLTNDIRNINVICTSGSAGGTVL